MTQAPQWRPFPKLIYRLPNVRKPQMTNGKNKLRHLGITPNLQPLGSEVGQADCRDGNGPTPAEGLRQLKAFERITDSTVRAKLIAQAERTANGSTGRLTDAR
jgi:hypothetical protein